MAIVYSLYALGRLSSSLYLIYPCVFIYQKMTGAFAKPIAYGLTIEIEILAFLEDLFEVKTLGINSLKLEVDLTNFFFFASILEEERGMESQNQGFLLVDGFLILLDAYFCKVQLLVCWELPFPECL